MRMNLNFGRNKNYNHALKTLISVVFKIKIPYFYILTH